MTEHEFTLADRIAKIRSINEQFDLEHNAYVSFSGGKDSTVLHYLIDEALPGNRIPRVFINTGIEYKLILKFVKEMAAKDDRFVIWTVGKNIKNTLNNVGWPFKSKEHSLKLRMWKSGSRAPSILKYFREVEGCNMPCPKSLMYQKDSSFNINISDRCCFEFKKKPAQEYAKQSGRFITITGMLKEEQGQRSTINCIVTDDKGKIKKFHPLSVVSHEWEKWYIDNKSIQLALKLSRVWTPYTSRSNKVVRWVIQCGQLDTLEQLMPEEKKRCEWLWKPIYDEYRRIGYRLRKKDNLQQSLFEGL